MISGRELAFECEVEGKGENFRSGQIHACEFSLGTAVAPTSDGRDLAAPLTFAAVGEGGVLPGLFLQLMPAAACVVGALFGRTAADVAITYTITGHGMDQGLAEPSDWHKRAHDDDQIDHCEHQGR